MDAAAVRARAVAALLPLVLFAARPARADGGDLTSLDYQSDPALTECPSAAAFRAGIARQLGKDPIRPGARHRLIVRLFPSGAKTEGQVEWRDANDQWEGERTFSSRNESCAQLVRAMALATAIQLQLLEQTEAEPPPANEPPSPPAATVEGTPMPVAPPPPPAPPAERPVTRAPLPAAVSASEAPPLTVDVGVGAFHDFGGGPIFLVPHIAVSVGLPWNADLRLAASGLGPGADVTRAEGVAHIDRTVLTLALVRFFRPGRVIQPLVAVGIGMESVHARGTSAMPDFAKAHQGSVFSGLVTAGGGLAFAVHPQLSLVVEVEMLLSRPAVTIDVGNSQAAYLDGLALFPHGGLLARF